MKSAVLCLALTLASLSHAASPGEKKLVVLFTGDNGGEIAPCG